MATTRDNGILRRFQDNDDVVGNNNARDFAIIETIANGTNGNDDRTRFNWNQQRRRGIATEPTTTTTTRIWYNNVRCIEYFV